MVYVDIVIHVGLIAAFTSMDFGFGRKVVFQNIGSCSLHSVWGHPSVVTQCWGRCTFSDKNHYEGVLFNVISMSNFQEKNNT